MLRKSALRDGSLHAPCLSCTARSRELRHISSDISHRKHASSTRLLGETRAQNPLFSKGSLIPMVLFALPLVSLPSRALLSFGSRTSWLPKRDAKRIILCHHFCGYCSFSCLLHVRMSTQCITPINWNKQGKRKENETSPTIGCSEVGGDVLVFLQHALQGR